MIRRSRPSLLQMTPERKHASAVMYATSITISGSKNAKIQPSEATCQNSPNTRKCAWPSCTLCPRRLAEASSHDKLWGIGLSACDPDSTNASTGMCAALATTSCKKDCEHIVPRGNIASFSQKYEIRLALGHIGERRLAEACTHDKLCCTGLSACDLCPSSHDTWSEQGPNLISGAVILDDATFTTFLSLTRGTPEVSRYNCRALLDGTVAVIYSVWMYIIPNETKKCDVISCLAETDECAFNHSPQLPAPGNLVRLDGPPALKKLNKVDTIPRKSPPPELLHRPDHSQRESYFSPLEHCLPPIHRIDFALDAAGWGPTALDALSTTLTTFADVFSSSKLDYGECSLRPFEIKAPPGTRPIQSRPYRLNLVPSKQADAILDSYLVAGLIQHSA